MVASNVMILPYFGVEGGWRSDRFVSVRGAGDQERRKWRHGDNSANCRIKTFGLSAAVGQLIAHQN
jgi:hypothetical protein